MVLLSCFHIGTSGKFIDAHRFDVFSLHFSAFLNLLLRIPGGGGTVGHLHLNVLLL